MTTTETVAPDTLPETPSGWTKRLSLHLNFGGGKGAGFYTIHDEQGRKVEGIGYAYNSAEKVRGFTLVADTEERFYTWAKLREAYNEKAHPAG